MGSGDPHQLLHDFSWLRRPRGFGIPGFHLDPRHTICEIPGRPDSSQVFDEIRGFEGPVADRMYPSINPAPFGGWGTPVGGKAGAKDEWTIGGLVLPVPQGISWDKPASLFDAEI